MRSTSQLLKEYGKFISDLAQAPSKEEKPHHVFIKDCNYSPYITGRLQALPCRIVYKAGYSDPYCQESNSIKITFESKKESVTVIQAELNQLKKWGEKFDFYGKNLGIPLEGPPPDQGKIQQIQVLFEVFVHSHFIQGPQSVVKLHGYSLKDDCSKELFSIFQEGDINYQNIPAGGVAWEVEPAYLSIQGIRKTDKDFLYKKLVNMEDSLTGYKVAFAEAYCCLVAGLPGMLLVPHAIVCIIAGYHFNTDPDSGYLEALKGAYGTIPADDQPPLAPLELKKAVKEAEQIERVIAENKQLQHTIAQLRHENTIIRAEKEKEQKENIKRLAELENNNQQQQKKIAELMHENTTIRTQKQKEQKEHDTLLQENAQLKKKNEHLVQQIKEFGSSVVKTNRVGMW